MLMKRPASGHLDHCLRSSLPLQIFGHNTDADTTSHAGSKTLLLNYDDDFSVNVRTAPVNTLKTTIKAVSGLWVMAIRAS